MIGLLCDGLHNQTTDAVLALSPADVILKCGLTDLLPPVRNPVHVSSIDSLPYSLPLLFTGKIKWISQYD